MGWRGNWSAIQIRPVLHQWGISPRWSPTWFRRFSVVGVASSPKVDPGRLTFYTPSDPTSLLLRISIAVILTGPSEATSFTEFCDDALDRPFSGSHANGCGKPDFDPYRAPLLGGKPPDDLLGIPDAALRPSVN